MFKFLSYVFCAFLLYFIGNLIHDRYVYISDRRDWLEQGKNMACTAEDNARLLEHIRSDVFDSIQQRVAASNLTPRLAEFDFEIAPFREQSLVGEPFGMSICTKEHFPWKQSKGGLNDGNCSMPAYLYCTANVVVKIPGDLVKEADVAARYVPLRQYHGSETVSISGQNYELFHITAGVRKTVPRYALSRLFMEEQRQGKALHEFDYNVADLSGVIENWLQFHEKREEIMKSYQVANDIGGALTGGGYIGSINKLRNEQIQLEAPPANP